MKRNAFFISLASLFLIVGCNNNQGKVNPPVVERTTISSSVSMLPHSSYDLELTNGGEEVAINIENKDLLDVVVKDKNLVSIVALAEGTSKVNVLTDLYDYEVEVECLDLKITNTESYISVGNNLQISLSKNVPVTYEIDDTSIAEVSSSGFIRAKKEGVFTLKVTYKDIVISKDFDTYIRKNELDIFNRNNPFIHYLGRNFHENKKVRMDNEGSGFEVVIEGTKLLGTFSAKSASYYGYTMVSVLVDDEIDTTKRVVTLNKSAREYEYTLVENLTPGFHTIKVLKRTENLSTFMTLSNLKTDGKFHPVNKGDVLKMEVYGDSITAGYGNLRGSLSDQTSAIYQSGLQTYASYTAFALGAEINIQARSGIGLYTANNTIGEGHHVKDYYNRVNYDGEHYWNFDNYTPDIVLINLGTNDYWDSAHFNSETYITNYVNFVTSLASNYGDDTSFVLLSGLMEQEVNQFVLQVKLRLASLPNQVFTYQFSKCNEGHPVYPEHAKASDELVRLIRQNHLDVIHHHEDSKVIPESAGETITASLKVKLQDEILEDSSLFVNVNNHKMPLTKEDAFTYSGSITNVVEGDYPVYFTIDDNAVYRSNDYIAHARKNYVDEIVLDTFLNSPVEDDSVFGWTVTSHIFEEEVTITSETQVTVMNKNWLAGMVVRDSIEGDNYKLSTTVKFANAITDYTQSYAGFVVYYLDDSNFVVAYLQWDSTGAIRGIGCTGLMDGQSIGWNDFFGITGFETNPTTGIDFAVTRNGTKLTVECGGKSESQNISGLEGDSYKVGVWNSTSEVNPVTYSNFTEVHAEVPVDPDWRYVAGLNPGSMTVNSTNSVTLTNTSNWLAGFAIKELARGDNYSISATLKCSKDSFVASEDVVIGFVPYYVNNNNFVVVYLQWNDQGKIKSMGCTGMINGQDIGWHDNWNYQNLDTTLATGQYLTVTRSGATLSIQFGGVSGNISISNIQDASSGYVGLYSNNTTTTFNDIIITSL